MTLGLLLGWARADAGSATDIAPGSQGQLPSEHKVPPPIGQASAAAPAAAAAACLDREVLSSSSSLSTSLTA